MQNILVVLHQIRSSHYFLRRLFPLFAHSPGGGPPVGGSAMRRFHCDTAIWHVFARGARRLHLFHDDEDFSKFAIFLAFAVKKSGCVLWAFALMNNHYHLVLRGASAQLTACMHRLNRLYSAYHNA